MESEVYLVLENTARFTLRFACNSCIAIKLHGFNSRINFHRIFDFDATRTAQIKCICLMLEFIISHPQFDQIQYLWILTEIRQFRFDRLMPYADHFSRNLYL